MSHSPQPKLEAGPARATRGPGGSSHVGLYIILAAALAYCAWIGAHWLPLGYSDKELAASASRVWDVKRELTEHGGLPWWTPNFMSGSSYALNYSRGFYLVPWILFSTFTSLDVAGKLMALCAIFASAVTMYFCARHFLRDEWAAVLAGVAYMLYPEQLTRAATQEHMTISLFMPFAPLMWWLFARSLQSGKFRDVFWCGLAFVFAMWTDYKQIFVQEVFLFGYLLYWLCLPERRPHRAKTVRTCVMLGIVFLGLGAVFLTPVFVESKYVKLFAGDPLEAWQRTYAFKSLLALVDRDGVATRHAVAGLVEHARSPGFHPASEQEAAQLQSQIARVLSLKMDSPEKYGGLVLLALIGWAALFNRRRADRGFFWFCVGAAMASVSLATGLSSVAAANWKTFIALLGLSGVPAFIRLAAILMVSGVAAALAVFAKRKLTTRRKWAIAGGVLAAFLFLPAFGWLAHLPLFKEIRAPNVFFGLPFAFLGALLAGFFVTDVLSVPRWRAHAPKVVAAVAVLMLVDYWPYQKATHENPVSKTTLGNLEAAYTALRKDPDWVKAYAISGRYFCLFGPMWSGKPQVYEAFYNWMAPLGTGLLNQQASRSWDEHRAFLNLMNARYVVYDKTDPDNAGNAPLLALYRQTFPVALENEDFAVFCNDTAHPYVTGYARACLFDGDLRDSPQLALALAARNWPLVHKPAGADAASKYERIYGNGDPPMAASRDNELVQFTDLRLVREDAQRIRIHLNAPRDCLAVIAESYYPYWRAQVDGKPVELLRVSCGLMGVNLSAGTHEIVLRYEAPRLYALTGIISLLALIGFGAAAFRRRS
jgi:hypothetical protein